MGGRMGSGAVPDEAQPPRLVILAESFHYAMAFAGDQQLMPGWRFVRVAQMQQMLAGVDQPTVLVLAALNDEQEAILRSRRPVEVLDRRADLDRWRRP